MRDYVRSALDALTRGTVGFASEPTVGAAVMAARWIGESHGAVLALRLRRDGTWDGTTLLFTRVGNGWEYCAGGGGGWPDPTDRPAGGSSGAHIDRFGVTAIAAVRVVRGRVSGRVARLVLDSGERRQELEVDTTTGAYLAGSERAESIRLVAYAADGEEIEEALVSV